VNRNPIIGRRIGRYEIRGEIGRGGMGIVYRAIQTSLNRTVAIKMLPYQLASSSEFLLSGGNVANRPGTDRFLEELT
jgi:serine/threonine-protein kinase